MANPPTKDNLESEFFLSFSKDIQAKLTACLRSDPAHIGKFSPASEAIDAIKQGLNRVQPKNPPMKVINDATNVFTQAMADAVLIYKGNNGIVRTGQKLDDVVGRMTLARLDTELKNLGDPKPTPPPKPQTFGEDSWSFRFSCQQDVIFTATRQFEIFIKSQNFALTSRTFDCSDPFTQGNLRASDFKGTTRGFFKSNKKLQIEDFEKKVCFIKIRRISRTLDGSITISDAASGDVLAQFFLPAFRDETIAFSDGSMTLDTRLKKQ